MMLKIASASGNFHEITHARNAGSTPQIKTISCFLIGYYNKIFKVSRTLNGQWIALKKGCYRDFENHATLSRYGSDSKPEAEGYFEHIQKFLTRIKGQTDEQLLEQKMLEDNEEW